MTISEISKTKILAVGLDEFVSEDLTTAGYDVQALELGQPYSFEPSASLMCLPPVPEFPLDYKEHDIVIFDLTRDPVPLDSLPRFSAPAKGVKGWWAEQNTGRINPGLLRSLSVRNAFDRILAEGGVFVIFLGEPESQEFFFGADAYRGIDVEQRVTCHSFAFSSALDDRANLSVFPDAGKSIALASDVSSDGVIGSVLKRHLNKVRFRCGIRKRISNVDQDWTSILENKFGSAVGALLTYEKGSIVLLPDFENKSDVLVDLLRDVLPEFAPQLFPNSSTSSWTTNALYEPTDIIQLSADIEAIREKAARDIDMLKQRIATRREEVAIQFDLARETGERLVEAVKSALTILGFQNMLDADEKLRDSGISGQNREDLQILDQAPSLIVEIKGIRGFPSDDDALAVQKYVVLRMREWKRTGVKGIAIINHQRGLPPLLRDNANPFRADLVNMAVEQQIGLLTGWDLYRLLRSFLENQWLHDDVKDIFYRNGRISILPLHYEFVGTVERYISKANIIGVRLTAELQLGDMLGYELAVVFREEKCESLQVDNQIVQSAVAGDLVGIKTQLHESEVKIGMAVYKVKRST